MKIHLDTRRVPDLTKALGKENIDFEFNGETVGDLIEGLASKYGAKAREALYDSRGNFDGMIQIILNSKEWVPSDKLETRLKPDDRVSLMLLIGGG